LKARGEGGAQAKRRKPPRKGGPAGGGGMRNKKGKREKRNAKRERGTKMKMQRKKILSLALAVFMLLSVFMPMSFADEPTSPYLKAITAGITFMDRKVRSGEAIKAHLILNWEFPGTDKGVDALDVTIAASDAMRLYKPESGSSENATVQYKENDDGTLTITVFDLKPGRGSDGAAYSLIIPFSAVFPNYTTLDGTPGFAYIKEIKIRGDAPYEPPMPTISPESGDGYAVGGDTYWNYGTAGYDYFSTASAIAEAKWKYVTGRTDIISQTIPYNASAAPADYSVGGGVLWFCA
jgi:hypothetical protein